MKPMSKPKLERATRVWVRAYVADGVNRGESKKSLYARLAKMVGVSISTIQRTVTGP